MKPDTAAVIANTSKEQDFLKREEVFEANREVFHTQIRYVFVKIFRQFQDLLFLLL
jgi:hypothetical protein